MKKRILSLFFVVVATLFAGNAFGQTLTFNVTNNTDFLLYGLFISPYNPDDESASTDWSEDLLKVTFDPGVTAVITIPEGYYPDYCKFKFKVSYVVDGETYEEVLCWVDACSNMSVKILPSNSGDGKYMKCQYE